MIASGFAPKRLICSDQEIKNLHNISRNELSLNRLIYKGYISSLQRITMVAETPQFLSVQPVQVNLS